MAALGPVLELARRFGFVGPGLTATHLVHATAFAQAIGDPPSGPALDLGSGAGLPGLALALIWPASRWVLLDAGGRRSDFLAEAVAQLGVSDRVEVARGRAEALGRDSRCRSRFELLTVRGFGPPAITAECAAPFLFRGGRLVVSEPPEPSVDRWPVEGLAQLGLIPCQRVRVDEANFQLLEQAELCPDRFPRREGIPRKRPLF